MIGNNYPIDMTMSVADRESQLKQAVQKDYEAINSFQKTMQEREDQWHQEVIDRQAKVLNKPYNQNHPENEVKNVPGYNPYILGPEYLPKALEMMDRAQRLYIKLYENNQNITNAMTTQDWLHIYASCIKDYDMNMKSIFRQNFDRQKYLNRDFLAEA